MRLWSLAGVEKVGGVLISSCGRKRSAAPSSKQYFLGVTSGRTVKRTDNKKTINSIG